ncbi:hypothetical protein GM3709_2469 [Geminocystis sp. NIES-3709]|nr:hypothetical protein GM3709_2469 [Geminocystis sp. NIES-3709]
MLQSWGYTKRKTKIVMINLFDRMKIKPENKIIIIVKS